MRRLSRRATFRAEPIRRLSVQRPMRARPDKYPRMLEHAYLISSQGQAMPPVAARRGGGWLRRHELAAPIFLISTAETHMRGWAGLVSRV